MKIIKRIFLITFLLAFSIPPSFAQDKGAVVDEIIAKVDNYVILKSELEKAYRDFAQRNQFAGETAKCRILESLIINKLMLAKAEIDSVVVSDEEVMNTLDRKMQYFINQIGSEDQIEEFYGKTIEEFKEELREQEKEQLLVQKMQSEITDNISVTPAEVARFFNNIPQDSLPYFSTEFSIAQIVKKPTIGQTQKVEARQKLLEIRDQIVNGPEITEAYNNVSVDLNRDGNLTINAPSGTYKGNWSLSDNFYTLDLDIVTDNDDIERLNGEWLVFNDDNTGIRLVNSNLDNTASFRLAPEKAEPIVRINPETMSNEWKITNARRSGESFSEMAREFSDDPGSAANGGSLGFQSRGQLVPAYEATALNLKPGEISKPVESQFGYHLIQLIERRGNEYNSRHILIKVNSSELDIEAAEEYLDSLRTQIVNDSISFEKAAKEYSDDKQTASNGGFILDENGNNRVSADNLEGSLYFTLDTMQVGEISHPIRFTMADGTEAVRIIYFKSKVPPHQASLKMDYQKIQQAALNEKKTRILNEWFEEAQKEVFVDIDDNYMHCEILNRSGSAIGKR